MIPLALIALTLATPAEEDAVIRRAMIEKAVARTPQARRLCEAYQADACIALASVDDETARKLATAYPEVIERFPKPGSLLRCIARSRYGTPVAQYALSNAEGLCDPSCFQAFTEGNTMEYVLNLKTLDSGAAEVRAKKLEPHMGGPDKQTLLVYAGALAFAFALGWVVRSKKKP